MRPNQRLHYITQKQENCTNGRIRVFDREHVTRELSSFRNKISRIFYFNSRESQVSIISNIEKLKNVESRKISFFKKFSRFSRKKLKEYPFMRCRENSENIRKT